MKKSTTTALLAAAFCLGACASPGANDSYGSANIHKYRGKKSARLSDAEYRQYQKQRENEVLESSAQRMKRSDKIHSVREGTQAAREGVDFLRDVMDLFRR